MRFVLDFEKQVVDLENKISALRESARIGDIDVTSEILKMQRKVDHMLAQLYKNLTPWQKTQVARHPERPKFTDYLSHIFTDFVELSGDKLFADDQAIIGGLAKINDIKCVVIGQEKGHDTESRLKHNFGMARPEGYRKTQRLLLLANRFTLPVFTFIDTPGACPDAGSEERGVATAIAECMMLSMQIDSICISIIIGEGGSGGAIALATSDYVLMLEHSIYSVISPEGCASILWKDDSKAAITSEFQRLTSQDLLSFGVIDSIIKEPVGGAHRNKNKACELVKNELITFYKMASGSKISSRAKARRQRFKVIGDEFALK
ncbi:MAG: acetyl-CoA carboxylase carboxyltransferase subunit alpha [Holosporales bacterium]|jgi:acetyl-CoA carboxylase carboxyl transferase subunit alpha|nr:acetyl-CoA carboxylase carboxyltransferase subunit alpha [Holosporales bacterium]